MTTKKCTTCGEENFVKNFFKSKMHKDGLDNRCKNCRNAQKTKFRNTEIGFLRKLYSNIKDRCRIGSHKCHFTFNEFHTAFEKHKSIYGMRSAWGLGIDHLEQHLPITIICLGNGQKGKKGVAKGTKRIASNLSVDRLDSNMDYTLQNLIFIRFDENTRKHSSSYKDCKIHMRLHEERFINMEAI